MDRYCIADTGNNRVCSMSVAAGANFGTLTGRTNVTGVHGLLDVTNNVYVLYDGFAAKYIDSAGFALQWTDALQGTTHRHITADATTVYATVDNRVETWNEGTGVHGSNIGSAGSGNGQFNTPWRICIVGSELYVVDSGNSRVQVFNLSGVYQRQWAINAGAKGIFPDGAGGVWVVETVSGQLRRFSGTGTLLDTINGLTNPVGGVRITGDVLFANNATAGTILKLDEAASSASGPTWNNTVQVGEALGALALSVTNGGLGDTANVVNSRGISPLRTARPSMWRPRSERATRT